MDLSDRRKYDDASVTVLIEGGNTFAFDVQDWDTEDEPLTAEQAHEMARGLVMDDQVLLIGKLNGKPASLVISPERVILHYVTPGA